MLSKALILLTLLSQIPHYLDTESWDQREQRMDETSEAILSAVDRATCKNQPEPCRAIWPKSRKELGMLLIEQAISESHLSHRIQDNQCRLEKRECDSTKIWNFREKKPEYFQQSYSLWQLKRHDIPTEDWTLISQGRAGTAIAAWHAARRLSGAYQDCGTIAGAISRYAVGSGCSWKGAGERVRLYEKLLTTSPEVLEKLKQKRFLSFQSSDLPPSE